MVEEWKTVIIDGEVFENYEVSSYGNVRNAKTGRVLKPSRTQDGYLQVGLCNNGKRKTSNIMAIHGIMLINRLYLIVVKEQGNYSKERGI